MFSQAGEPGFEPGLTGSEPVVLPLHHSPKVTFLSNVRLYFDAVRLVSAVDGFMADIRHLVSSPLANNFTEKTIKKATCACPKVVPQYYRKAEMSARQLASGSKE